MTFCRHTWSFPRRRATFGAHTNVDVQTCTECGARRLSSIQFKSKGETVVDTPEKGDLLNEVPARA
jgi:hypothetical protein